MILWIKRGAAVLSGIFLTALLFPAGSQWGGTAGGILNLGFVVAEKFHPSLRRPLSPLVLVFNTVLSAYGVLIGGVAAWAILAAGTSLISWNAGLFLHRWSHAPLPVQYQYFRRIGGILAVGLGAGISALALQGHFSLGFLPTLALALIGSILFLRLISGVFEKAGSPPQNQ